MSYIGNPPVVQATRLVTEVEATQGQTTFFPAGGYTPGYLDVEVNGVTLVSADYTATDGASVVLANACGAGDVVRFVAFGNFTVADAYTKAETDVLLDGKLGNGAGAVQQSNLASGVAGNGPAFHAFMSNTQPASATVFTNVAFNQELFDTASCFNNTGSTVGGIPAYAFLPNVAGYYQVSTSVYNQAANQVNIIRLYKNGTYLLEMSRLFLASAPTLNGAGLVYLNGTTDYIQVYFYCSASTTIGSNDGALAWFQAALVRAA